MAGRGATSSLAPPLVTYPFRPSPQLLITKISDATTQHCCWLMGSGVRIKTKQILVRVVMLTPEERNGPPPFSPDSRSSRYRVPGICQGKVPRVPHLALRRKYGIRKLQSPPREEAIALIRSQPYLFAALFAFTYPQLQMSDLPSSP